MSRLEELLSRLTKVRKSGSGYIACCPAHDDSNPSLSVCEGADGRVLLHCFAGCAVDEVVQAVGLQLSNLMPDTPLYQRKKPQAVPFNPRDVLACVRRDCYFLGVWATDVARGAAPDDAARLSALQAAGRLIAAADMAEKL